MIGQEKKDKAIRCFTQASDYNISQAQLFLGHIYFNEKEYFDINKAIHYFKLAANNNLSEAQYKLGVIYYTGQYVVADISIAIHFLSLASNQNHINAQIYLGLIYSDKRFCQFNIQNSIYYFSLTTYGIIIPFFNLIGFGIYCSFTLYIDNFFHKKYEMLNP